MTSLVQKYGEAIQIERFAVTTFTSGKPNNPAVTTIPITATVMPIPIAELKVLSEGQEDAAGIYVYSEDEIKPVSEDGKTKPDVILWGGKRWQVVSANNRYQLPGLAHWKATAMREDID